MSVRKRIYAVTIYKIVLKAAMPSKNITLGICSPLGDHVRARREALGLRQADAAALLGVDKATVANWEKGRTSPETFQCAEVIQFLGYDPFPAPATFAEELVAFRRRRGLRVKDAAALAGVDPCSWSSWERVEHAITQRVGRRIISLLSTDEV